jgi:ATP-dependent helicase HrpA
MRRGCRGWRRASSPGFRAIRSLPKAMRRNCAGAGFRPRVLRGIPQPSADAITGELARLSRATGASVTALDFDEAALEPHLRMNLRLRDEHGKVLAESRDVDGLRALWRARRQGFRGACRQGAGGRRPA